MSLGVWKSSKKTIKFVVDLHLEELSSVPFLAGVIFAKLRLLSGGNFRRISDREEIVDHRVCWNSHFEFECKLTATLSTGTLDACTCRVSVRRESQGGKSYQKLGFADINLAEFAGGTPQSRSFLLEEYNSSTRANNALLRVTLCMRVKEGDFCFKVPQPSAPSSSFFSETLTFPEKPEHPEQPQIEKEATQGEHSRQSSSSDSGVVSREIASEFGSLERNSGRNSALSSGPMLDREKVGSSRVDSTRVDPEYLIDELLRESNLESSPNEGGGLTLFIGKDGSAAVVGD
ncbi:protein FAM102A [Folsomia candida]|uniref:protein FAM102A n=1 Tax=Folsomia candida TaxID=158441 RepID=UPI000B902619|nr:protein FAM102A [Folsomia candida]